MRTLIQGKLYATDKDLKFQNKVYRKGTLVVYIEEDHLHFHWVLLPNGQRESMWSGHLEEICK